MVEEVKKEGYRDFDSNMVQVLQFRENLEFDDLGKGFSGLLYLLNSFASSLKPIWMQTYRNCQNYALQFKSFKHLCFHMVAHLSDSKASVLLYNPQCCPQILLFLLKRNKITDTAVASFNTIILD